MTALMPSLAASGLTGVALFLLLATRHDGSHHRHRRSRTARTAFDLRNRR